MLKVVSDIYEAYDDRGLDGSDFAGEVRKRLGAEWFANIKRDRAADIGTVTHARCEAFLHGLELDEEGLAHELVDKSANGFVRFHDWWTASNLSVLHSELQMVSESMQVGGTADIVAMDANGSLVLVDLKTSKASKWWPYPEVFGQVAAYAEMFREQHRQEITTLHIVRIGKEEADAGQTYTLTAHERDAGLKLFRAALAVYEAQKELKR